MNLIQKIKKIFIKNDDVPMITVLSTEEQSNGDVIIQVELSSEGEKILKHGAKKAKKTVEEFLVDLLVDYIRKIK